MKVAVRLHLSMCCLGADDTIADACYGFHAGYGQAHASPKGRTLAADRPPSSQSPQVTALPAAHICLHTMQLLIAFISASLACMQFQPGNQFMWQRHSTELFSERCFIIT